MKKIKRTCAPKPYPHEIQEVIKMMPKVGTILLVNQVHYMTINSDKKKGELTLKIVFLKQKEETPQKKRWWSRMREWIK